MMEKRSVVFISVLGTLGGLLLAIGMCMCLLPEWNAFTPGVVLAVIGAVTLTVEDYVQRIMEAIEERKTYVVFQYQEGDDSLANIEAATKTFWDEKPTVDGLDYGTGYGLTRGTNYDTQTCSITIRYYE